ALLITTLYSGMMTGYMHDMERSIVEYEVGDIQIFAPGYQKKPSIYTAIADPEALVARLQQAGFRASARYLGGGLGAAGAAAARRATRRRAWCSTASIPSAIAR